jgi:hypothetical protein
VLNTAFLLGLLALQQVPAAATPPVGAPFAYPGSPGRGSRFWDSVFDAARADPSVRRALFDFVSGADVTVRSDPSWYRRPTRFDEIPPSQVDALALRSGPNRDVRALSMNDCRQADFLRSKVFGLAIAARYTGNPDYLAKVVEVLEEVTRWQPFQRPGWSLGDAGRQLPPGGDGVNMATAWGVHGVIDILDVLGDRVPVGLRDRLRERIRGEVAAIVDSWTARRPWYVQSDAAMSNQWVDPSAALVRACLFLREPHLADEYELGVRNVTRTLGMSSSDGAFLEGVTYAQMSFGPLFEAIVAMNDSGDTRLMGSPFVRSAWNWFLHQLMPCGALVNCSDSHMSRLPEWALRAPLDGLAMAALASGSRDATAAVRSLFPDIPASSAGLRLALAQPTVGDFPAGIVPWGYFPSQQLVTWREAFRPPTDRSPELGIWIKGGSPLCRSHAHRDQGHVSVYRGCRELLLECGTPDYTDPDYEHGFAGAAGHGILQLDPVEPSSLAVDAPLAVRRMDASGGLVQLELTRAYRSIQSYVREIEWDRERVQIRDRVSIAAPIAAGREVLRFHVGSDAPLQLDWENGVAVLTAESVPLIQIRADVAFRVLHGPARNRTIASGRHQVVQVTLAEDRARISVDTTVLGSYSARQGTRP